MVARKFTKRKNKKSYKKSNKITKRKYSRRGGAPKRKPNPKPSKEDRKKLTKAEKREINKQLNVKFKEADDKRGALVEHEKHASAVLGLVDVLYSKIDKADKLSEIISDNFDNELFVGEKNIIAAKKEEIKKIRSDAYSLSQSLEASEIVEKINEFIGEVEKIIEYFDDIFQQMQVQGDKVMSDIYSRYPRDRWNILYHVIDSPSTSPEIKDLLLNLMELFFQQANIIADLELPGKISEIFQENERFWLELICKRIINYNEKEPDGFVKSVLDNDIVRFLEFYISNISTQNSELKLETLRDGWIRGEDDFFFRLDENGNPCPQLKLPENWKLDWSNETQKWQYIDQNNEKTVSSPPPGTINCIGRDEEDTLETLRKKKSRNLNIYLSGIINDGNLRSLNEINRYLFFLYDKFLPLFSKDKKLINAVEKIKEFIAIDNEERKKFIGCKTIIVQFSGGGRSLKNNWNVFNALSYIAVTFLDSVVNLKTEMDVYLLDESTRVHTKEEVKKCKKNLENLESKTKEYSEPEVEYQRISKEFQSILKKDTGKILEPHIQKCKDMKEKLKKIYKNIPYTERNLILEELYNKVDKLDMDVEVDEILNLKEELNKEILYGQALVLMGEIKKIYEKTPPKKAKKKLLKQLYNDTEDSINSSIVAIQDILKLLNEEHREALEHELVNEDEKINSPQTEDKPSVVEKILENDEPVANDESVIVEENQAGENVDDENQRINDAIDEINRVKDDDLSVRKTAYETIIDSNPKELVDKIFLEEIFGSGHTTSYDVTETDVSKVSPITLYASIINYRHLVSLLPTIKSENKYGYDIETIQADGTGRERIYIYLPNDKVNEDGRYLRHIHFDIDTRSDRLYTLAAKRGLYVNGRLTMTFTCRVLKTIYEPILLLYDDIEANNEVEDNGRKVHIEKLYKKFSGSRFAYEFEDYFNYVELTYDEEYKGKTYTVLHINTIVPDYLFHEDLAGITEFININMDYLEMLSSVMCGYI